MGRPSEGDNQAHIDLLARGSRPGRDRGALVDLGKGHAQQIFQRVVGIPTPGHFQLAPLSTEPSQREDAGGRFSGHFLATRGHEFTQQRVQSQAPPSWEDNSLVVKSLRMV